ncbi:Tyrosine recombinase XerD [uncultured archaeon]|nr:Tyrosine recombinase XerD [uncultured archaeon]
MDVLQKYLKDLSVAGYSRNSIVYKQKFLEQMSRIKKIETWTKDDVDNYLYQISQTKARATVENAKTCFVSFFKRIGQPEKVSHLTIKMVEGTLRRDELLTYDDVIKLIDATDSVLYKALLIFLFESGARINEVLAVKVSDVMETDIGMVVHVHQTKYGVDKRRVICIYSASYIRNLLTYLNLGKGDYLFPSPKNLKRNHGQPVSLNSQFVPHLFREIAKKAGIEKPVNPHAFRHACATNLVLQEYPESLIKKGLGWKPTSRAINRYTHVVDDDFINARLEKEGVVQPHEKPQQQIKLAEPIQFSDDKTILRRLVVENQELQKKVADTEKLAADFEEMKKAFGLMRNTDGNYTFNAVLKELPQKKKKDGVIGLISSEKLDDGK